MSQEEYEKLFTKFYSDFFKFKSGKKSQLRCPGCQSEKRFIIDDDKLVYSCGPSSDPKCGKQYTINLPKYIHYRTLREIYEKNINGSLEYQKDNILQYDLSEYSQKMDVKTELDEQNMIIKKSTDNLKRLIDDYNKSNGLDEYIEDLEKLSEMRYKNSIEKSKIMKSLNEDELSEPEKIVLRKKYAVCIKENTKFIEIIQRLNKDNSDYIMIKKPDMTIHKREEKTEEVKKPLKTDKQKKQKCSKAHPPPPCPPGKEVPEGKDCCYNEKGPKKKKKPKKDSPKSEREEESPKKYSFDEQLKILIEYYSKVDKNKTGNDIKRIINNRRPKDTPKGTSIPTEQWLDLCETLNKKYNIHPLK
jgi:hypothetical protein